MSDHLRPDHVLEVQIGTGASPWAPLSNALTKRDGTTYVMVVTISGPLATEHDESSAEVVLETLHGLQVPSLFSILVLEAAASGPALLRLAAATDLRLADGSARLGPGELTLGTVPWLGVSAAVARRAPSARWLGALSATGVTAAQAKDLGLVDLVAETTELSALVHHYVEQVSAIDRGLLAETKVLSLAMPGAGMRQEREAWLRSQAQHADGGVG